MYLSEHARERSAERVIDIRFASLAFKFGKPVHGCQGVVLLKKENLPPCVFKEASPALRSHIEHQLPVVVVFSGDTDTVVTMYKPEQKLRWKRGRPNDYHKERERQIKAIRQFAE